MKESPQQVKKKAKVISAGLLVTILFFALIVFALWQITDDFALEKENKFDLKVFEILSQYINPVTTQLMLICTFFGSAMFILPAYVLLAAILYFYKRNKWLSITIVVIGLASRLLLFIIKNIFRRDRPIEPLTDLVHGYSYPSGHSFSSFTLFGLLTYIIWKTNLSKFWKWCLSVFFILFAICIAISRVYLHVHYASDVIAGFCLSLLWLGISLWIIEKVVKEKW